MRNVLGFAGMGLCLVVFVAAYRAGDIIRADRFVVFNQSGDPAIVITTSKIGAGEFIVYDSKGDEILSVRNGKISGELANRLKRIETSLEIGTQHRAADLPSTGFVMMLEGVSAVPVDEALLAESARLLKQADALQVKADGIKGTLAAGYHHDDDITKKTRQGLKELMLGYRRDAQRLRGRSIRLERKAKEARQILHGWNGNRTVILESVRDLSSAITKLQPGDFISWEGVRIEMTDEIERFSIHRVELTTQPKDFAERGADWD